MPKENFLLVSLKGDEAKKLAQVISNDTSRRILDMLAGVKDATETDIAEKLKLPISTVHYNISALCKAKLVHAHEFHYSEKGKEVNHYSLANKYVIIAPKDAPDTLKSKLKRILPVALVAVGASAIIQLFSRFFRRTAGLASVAPQDIESAAKEAAPMMAERAQDSFANAATGAQGILADQAAASAHPLLVNNMALWFLYGAVFTIIIFIVVDWIQRRKAK